MSQVERKAAQAAAQLEAARRFAEQRQGLAPTTIAHQVSNLFPGPNPYRHCHISVGAFIDYTGCYPNGDRCTHPDFIRSQYMKGASNG